jgi:putative DNA primase/helicase
VKYFELALQGSLQVRRSTPAQRRAVLAGYDEAPAAPTRARRPRAAAASSSEEQLVDTDIANARRLATRHGRDLVHVHGLGWLVWDGKRFARDVGDVEIMRRAQETVHSIWSEEVPGATDVRTAERLVRWAKASGLLPRLRAMVELASRQRAIARSPAELDANPDLLNVGNGTLNLRTGILEAHDRADLITKISPVFYDPNAPCLRWNAFLDETFRGDPALISFVQWAIGYSLSGHVAEQKFFLCIGEGGHGKGVIQRTMMRIAGDYAVQANFETFLGSKFGHGSASYDLAGLAGARWIGAGEPAKGARWDEARLKAFTGEDRIRAAFKYRDEFEYSPVGKLWFLANDPPTTRDTGESMRRRLLLIPFTARIPDEQKNLHLTEELLAEAPGILAWAVAGAAHALRHGLKPPASVRLASEAYLADADIIGRFVGEQCRVLIGNLDLRTSAATLYQRYHRWCTSEGVNEVTKIAFGRDLRRRGLGSVHTVAGQVYTGIALKESVQTAGADDPNDRDDNRDPDDHRDNDALTLLTDSAAKSPNVSSLGITAKTNQMRQCSTELKIPPVADLPSSMDQRRAPG